MSLSSGSIARLRDFHDLYITSGPATLDEDSENITDQIFCVFFIILFASTGIVWNGIAS